MKGAGAAAGAVFLLWIAAILNLSVATRLSVLGGTPDFPLVVLACLSLRFSRRGSTVLGFGSGLVTGVLAGANMTIYVASRCVTGFLLGWFNSMDFEATALMAAVLAFGSSIVAQLLVLFLGAYHGPLPRYLGGTISTAVYNAVIAVPVYALLRKIAATSRAG